MTAISPRVCLYPVRGNRPQTGPHTLALPQLMSKAFGDGSHPTTRICAGAVDLICRQTPGLAVLDVGTGTGVLARIARARGAAFVAATEIDPLALEAAQANAALDTPTTPIEILNVAPDHWGPRFDLVVANILEGPLRELAPGLARALRPHGTLLLSGFTPLQVGALRVAFEAQGLQFGSESSLDGWSLIKLLAS